MFIAGFHALTGTEEAVFRALAEDGAARLVWHSDPLLAEAPDRAHWSCREHARQLASWSVRAELVGPPCQRPEPVLHFHEGFDLHSQLGALRGLLEAADLSDTAVVLPDTGSLMPVLHHLPVKDVNISMGYPLERSSLFRLLETVLRLQETARDPAPDPAGGTAEAPARRRYYWREVVALIRHPYVKMLEPVPGLGLRGLLRELERSVRRGGKWTDPLAWEPDAEALAAALPEPLPEGLDAAGAMEHLRAVLSACLTAFETPRTLEAFAAALLDLARTLVPEGGEHVWHRFPVDAECLYRLAASLVPALADSHVSRDPLDQPVLFSMLRQMMRAERVPFEAEPLTGLQVLGMLESRLLRFSRVFVLDATEDKLPGAAPYDPLLPDPLRVLLDLPGEGVRAQVAAYNFHRLTAGADEVHLLYQAGADAPGPQGGKAIRSRFVEQLLWREEQRLGRLIEPGPDGPLSVITLPLAPLPPRPGLVPRTAALDARLTRLLHTRALSASLLDTYLGCPLRFFHQYLTPLREAETVSEDGDPLELGTLVHGVLREFLAPWRGLRKNLAELDPAPLLDAFSARLAQAPFFTQMPYDLRLGMAATGRERLRRFLAASPETTIESLEQDMEAALVVDDLGLRLGGRFDRVDKRPEGRVVLDYKTGTVHAPQLRLWKDEALWERMQAWTPDGAPDQGDGDDEDGASDPLADLRRALPSVQLPLYAWIYWRATDILPADAAWVELADKGQETPLFGPKMDEETREEIVTERTPLVVRFLVRHMRGAPGFAAAPSPRCAWCPYGYACPNPPGGFGRR